MKTTICDTSYAILGWIEDRANPDRHKRRVDWTTMCLRAQHPLAPSTARRPTAMTAAPSG
jgi:hypothetical protein